MSENQSSTEFGAFLAGFVIGGLVGAAAALILAPQSGEQTRHQIMQKGSDLRGSASEYGANYRDTAGNYLAEARARASSATTHAQERFNIVLDEGKTKLADAKERITHATQRAQGDDTPQEDAEQV
ncbi:MAG: YtxH domain-containing protein [Chloroflexi bacterium]|nr:YtxH domain-containing protein [Chloroflexota bacterium]MDA0246269.1 YtxH domain-containing protein [Chloroflexota bacterium]